MVPVTITSMNFALGHSRPIIPLHDFDEQMDSISSARSGLGEMISSEIASRQDRSVIEGHNFPVRMLSARIDQLCSRKVIARRRPDANTAVRRRTDNRWTRPERSWQNMLCWLSVQRMAAFGLVRTLNGSNARHLKCLLL